jgi:hypothetical protein
MPHSSLAAANCLSDFCDRFPLLHQEFQFVLRESTSRRVLAVVGHLQFVLLDPIADRRFMQPKPLTDLGKRQSLAQKLLQRSAIHAPHCLRRSGRKRADFQPIPCQLCALGANGRRPRT